MTSLASAPSRPSKPLITAQSGRKPNTVQLLNQWHTLEGALMRIIAAWGVPFADWDDKAATHRFVWEQAEIVRKLRERLREFPGTDSNLDAPVSQQLELLANTVLLAPSFEDAIDGIGALSNALTKAYAAYAEFAHPVHDAPTLAVLREIGGLKESRRLWLRDYRRRFRHKTDKNYLVALENGLETCRNLGKALEIEEAAQQVGVRTNFQMLTYARNDAWATPHDIFPDLHADFETSIEARHGESGRSRLLDFGIEREDFGCRPFAEAQLEPIADLTPQELYEQAWSIGMVAETGHFTVKNEAYADFKAGGDLESAEMVLFDVIDEGAHVQYCHEWLPARDSRQTRGRRVGRLSRAGNGAPRRIENRARRAARPKIAFGARPKRRGLCALSEIFADYVRTTSAFQRRFVPAAHGIADVRKNIKPLENTGSLTNEPLETYDREGYIVLENLLSDDDMAPAREAMSQKVAQIADELFADGLISNKFEDAPFKYRLAKLFENLTDEDFLKYGRGWRDRWPGYFHFLWTPKILGAVESLIGPELFANPVYNGRPKVPGVAAGAVPWHQDKSYWPDTNANPVITVWIPLVDSTHENGCLHLIPRTHKKRAVSHGKESYSGTSYLEIAPSEIESRKKEIIALPMKAGSAVLFNDRLIHSSTPNKSDHVRWSVDLRYQPTDQDPMPQHGIGFLVRSRQNPAKVAQLEDFLAGRMEHGGQSYAESVQK